MKSNCTINIMPEVSKADESVNIEISGLLKNQKVIIRALSNDYYCINTSIFDVGDKAEWESYAVFTADENGNIDLENAKPIEGTYKNIDKMGLFYSMSVKKNQKANVPTSLNDIGENRNHTITFQVESNGAVIASKVHKRIYCNENIRSVNVIEDKLLARYFTSKDNTPRPAVIVLSGSDGRIEKAQAIAELFAMHGYSALAVAYFALEGTKESLSCIDLEYVENAINWLKKQATVIKNKIGIYGRSKGGEMVLLSASMFKDISCVIANTPSCYVYEGLKTNSFPSRHSSWMYKGKEFPYIKFSFSILVRTLIKMMLRDKKSVAWMYNKLVEKGNVDEAVIPVEKINGPILMISSLKDNIWPSKIHCEIIVELLRKAHFKYEYKHITYEKSGHMLTVPYQSIYPSDKYPEDIDSYAKANIDCWKETISFLDKWTKLD
ncbi:acyl-CoA thioesterase/bile acid-CoA:amino acid N-acyltransferase family protein [Clostridium sp. JS66]|uniref:acyl-CoA thioesterase/bile acid-CoA:amino acid N-acyltransferase family protein n=1 Tax=Clostridium sp. JS66 TaxID=3064705 RepID=UPI00298DD16E|nr:acyl-CoA thioester hydrolase/BAAT C-terminal domain-containing protein [Clostridium sp. JS66]WPC40095.1 acyl-CoA thioester hydrolase/BAAT C-terminal domain-containing protein [Clostridium sp. JS66]